MTRVGVGKYFAGFRVILHKGTQRTIGFLQTLLQPNFQLILSLPNFTLD